MVSDFEQEAANASYLYNSAFITFATPPDDGNTTGLRWRGCHNSAASFYSCAAGFRLKSVGGCEQVSLSPHGVLALEVPPPGLRLALIAGNSLVYHLLGLSILAARLIRSYMGYVPEMPSIRLSKYIEGEKLVLLINTDKKGKKQAHQMKFYQKYFTSCFNPRRILSRTRLGSTPSTSAISFTVIPR